MADGPEQVAAENEARARAARARRQPGSRYRTRVGDPRVEAIAERILRRADDEFEGPMTGRPSMMFRRGIWEAIRALVRALVAEHLETRLELIELRCEVLEMKRHLPWTRSD